MTLPPSPAAPGPRAASLHPCVAWAIAYIDEHLHERLSLEDLAAKAGLSVWRFATVFRRQAGVPPRRYICGLRVRRVQALLADGMSAASAASAAGFYDQSHLSRHFKNTCGMTPGQYLASLSAPPAFLLQADAAVSPCAVATQRCGRSAARHGG
jgi:AraC-like DNA-binding protein